MKTKNVYSAKNEHKNNVKEKSKHRIPEEEKNTSKETEPCW